MEYVKYQNKRTFGLAGIHWRKDQNEFSMKLEVPVGSSAMVYIPAKENDTVLENEMEDFISEAIRLIAVNKETRVFEVDSGNYFFKVIGGQ
ncbi:MAG: hypothetical protein IPL46_01465 [Saprospiraceae bacterium]|nr:hypothetical protein [Saprospiraceae bacterium]